MAHTSRSLPAEYGHARIADLDVIGDLFVGDDAAASGQEVLA